MIEIAIPFVRVESINPNIREQDYEKALETYYKCICVSFFALRKFNPIIKLIFITNCKPNDRYLALLNSYGVELKLIEYSFMPPDHFGKIFKGSFYLLDAILNQENQTLYLDPDILCVREIPFQTLNHNLMFLQMPFDEKENINGITRLQAHEIFKKFSKKNSSFIQKHIGGECIFVQNLTEELKSEILKLWKFNIVLARKNEDFLTTEEHFLSVIAGENIFRDLNFMTARIWTGFKYRLIPPTAVLRNLSLLHLPAEKSSGFIWLFRMIEKYPHFMMKMNERVFRFFSYRKFHVRSIVRAIFFQIYRILPTK